MALGILDAPVNVTSTNTMPAISAGSNRLVLVTVCMYNGAGNATPPTDLIVNGVSGVLLAGDNSTNTRVASTTFMFLEADIAAISEKAISTSGQSGTVKSTVVMTLQGAHQDAVPAVNKAYATSSGTLTIGLARAANSFTVLIGYTSTNTQVMTLANPARTGSINFSNGAFNYGYAADSEQSINSTVAGSNYTTAHAINFVAAPSQSITGVNDGSGTAYYGQASTWTQSGFSPEPNEATVGGIPCSAVSGSGFTMPSLDDGAAVPLPGTRQLTGSNGIQSASINVTVAVPEGLFARLLVGTPDTGPGSVTVGFDPAAKAGDYVVYPASNNTSVDDKGRLKTDNEGAMNFVHISVDEEDSSIGTAYTYQVITGADGGLIILPAARHIEAAFPVATFISAETF